MVKITVKYNGRECNSISDAFQDATLQIGIEGVTETMKESIAPFESEILKEGGEVIFEITGDKLENIQGQIAVKNVSQELIDRIMTSLSQ